MELSAIAPTDPRTQASWAIYGGQCGSSDPAVTGINEFPPVEVSSGGAFVSAVMALSMDPHGSYHAVMYWASRGSNGTNGAMMCANLTQ